MPTVLSLKYMKRSWAVLALGLLLALLPNVCWADDFSALDNGMLESIRHENSSGFAPLLREDAVAYGEKIFSRHIAPRQSIAKAISQLLATDFLKRTRASKPPSASSLQLLGNILDLINSLAAAERGKDFTNGLQSLSDQLQKVYGEPLLSREKRHDLRPLAAPESGELVVQYFSPKSKPASMLVLDAYVTQQPFAVVWSTKAFDKRLGAVGQKIGNRAFHKLEGNHAVTDLVLYLDLSETSDAGETATALNGSIQAFPRLILVADNVAARVDICMEKALKPTDEAKGEETPSKDESPPSKKKSVIIDEVGGSDELDAEAVAAAEKAAADRLLKARKTCEARAGKNDYASRSILFDSSRDIVVWDKRLKDSSAKSLKMALQDARYIATFWPRS